MEKNQFPNASLFPDSFMHYSQGLQDEKIKLAIKYIEEHIGDAITITTLANELYISPSTVKRKFRVTLNCSVFQYIQFQKMKKAKALLDEGNFRISEIAHRVGYTNCSHFSDAFRKYYQVTPSEYLKKRR